MTDESKLEEVCQSLMNKLYMRFVEDNRELLTKLISMGMPLCIDKDGKLIDTSDMYSGPGEEDGPWAGEGWAERCGVKHGDDWECPNCTAPGKLRTSHQYDIMVEDAIRWNKRSEQWECHDCWLK